MMHLNDIMSLHKGQHLRLKERIEIQVLKRLNNKSHRFISKQLQRSHSTINDEIKRGTVTQVKIVNGKRVYRYDYYAETGQLIYERQRIACQAKGKLLKVEAFIQYATKHILEDKWSPDAVVGRFKQEAEHQQEAIVCTKFFPKGKSIDHLSKEQVKTFNQIINQSRIASLSGSTPNEALAKLHGNECLDFLTHIII